ncbi:Ultraviolet-B receptor UVR8 [Porphyridium purpureum]|uniref:Ultraviolet-B receptor UVR8 n=1 Tax=Porphyridium purpureum TaxID=35688 RepID=A0A5J4YYG6_PORPP|nr:Ultraviolet-B receptor UVR8 [Porphyridium purpureum]|eukprot:POR6188..scf209_3
MGRRKKGGAPAPGCTTEHGSQPGHDVQLLWAALMNAMRASEEGCAEQHLDKLLTFVRASTSTHMVEVLQKHETATGMALLHVAAASARAHVFRALLRLHVAHNVSVKLPDRGSEGWTPLHHAMYAKNMIAVKELMQLGVSCREPASQTRQQAVDLCRDVDLRREVLRPHRLLGGTKSPSFHADLGTCSSVRVYGYGRNEDFQLGSGDFRMFGKPLRVVAREESGDRLVGIATGTRHTLLLTEMGLVYGMGVTKNGRLFVEGVDVVAEPRLLCAFRSIRISSVHTSASRSALISTSGDLYISPTAEAATSQPTKPKGAAKADAGKMFSHRKVSGFADSAVVHVAMNEHVTFAVDQAGNLYGWGSNQGARLCFHEAVITSVATPRKIPFFQDKFVVRVFTSTKKTIAITEKGEAYLFGYNMDPKRAHLNRWSHARASQSIGPPGSSMKTQKQSGFFVHHAEPIQVVDGAAGEDFCILRTSLCELFIWTEENETHGNHRSNSLAWRLIPHLKCRSVHVCGARIVVTTMDYGDAVVFEHYSEIVAAGGPARGGVVVANMRGCVEVQTGTKHIVGLLVAEQSALDDQPQPDPNSSFNGKSVPKPFPSLRFLCEKSALANIGQNPGRACAMLGMVGFDPGSMMRSALLVYIAEHIDIILTMHSRDFLRMHDTLLAALQDALVARSVRGGWMWQSPAAGNGRASRRTHLASYLSSQNEERQRFVDGAMLAHETSGTLVRGQGAQSKKQSLKATSNHTAKAAHSESLPDSAEKVADADIPNWETLVMNDTSSITRHTNMVEYHPVDDRGPVLPNVFQSPVRRPRKGTTLFTRGLGLPSQPKSSETVKEQPKSPSLAPWSSPEGRALSSPASMKSFAQIQEEEMHARRQLKSMAVASAHAHVQTHNMSPLSLCSGISSVSSSLESEKWTGWGASLGGNNSSRGPTAHISNPMTPISIRDIMSEEEARRSQAVAASMKRTSSGRVESAWLKEDVQLKDFRHIETEERAMNALRARGYHGVRISGANVDISSR